MAAARMPNARYLVQCVNTRAGRNLGFLEMIAAQTLSALRTGNLLAKKPEVDFLMRVAGNAQIKQAIDRAGAKKGERFLLVVFSERDFKFRKRRGWSSLAKSGPRKSDLERVEQAALLNALRG